MLCSKLRASPQRNPLISRPPVPPPQPHTPQLGPPPDPVSRQPLLGPLPGAGSRGSPVPLLRLLNLPVLGRGTPVPGWGTPILGRGTRVGSPPPVVGPATLVEVSIPATLVPGSRHICCLALPVDLRSLLPRKTHSQAGLVWRSLSCVLPYCKLVIYI